MGDNKDITHKPSKGAIADAIGALFFILIITSNGAKNNLSDHTGRQIAHHSRNVKHTQKNKFQTPITSLTSTNHYIKPKFTKNIRIVASF